MFARARGHLRQHGIQARSFQQACSHAESCGAEQGIYHGHIIPAQLLIVGRAFLTAAHDGPGCGIGHIRRYGREHLCRHVPHIAHHGGQAFVRKQRGPVFADFLIAQTPGRREKFSQQSAGDIGLTAAEAFYRRPGVAHAHRLHGPAQRLNALIRGFCDIERRAREHIDQLPARPAAVDCLNALMEQVSRGGQQFVELVGQGHFRMNETGAVQVAQHLHRVRGEIAHCLKSQFARRSGGQLLVFKAGIGRDAFSLPHLESRHSRVLGFAQRVGEYAPGLGLGILGGLYGVGGVELHGQIKQASLFWTHLIDRRNRVVTGFFKYILCH